MITVEIKSFYNGVRIILALETDMYDVRHQYDYVSPQEMGIWIEYIVSNGMVTDYTFVGKQFRRVEYISN